MKIPFIALLFVLSVSAQAQEGHGNPSGNQQPPRQQDPVVIDDGDDMPIVVYPDQDGQPQPAPEQPAPGDNK